MTRKETVTLENIKQDLNQILASVFDNIIEWRFVCYIEPLTVASVLISIGSYIMFGNIWLGVLLFLIPLYHLVRFLIFYKQYRKQKKAIAMVLKREDISISLERLSHVSKENIYEPNHCLRRNYATKEVDFLNFRSLRSWRAQRSAILYKWSNEHYMSGDMVEKTSIPDDEFYYVSLQGFEDVSCVYPCKFFELDKKLIT